MRGNMSPIQHVLVNLFGKGLARIVCFLAVSFASLAFGAGELTADSVLASFDSVGTVDASVNADSAMKADSSVKVDSTVKLDSAVKVDSVAAADSTLAAPPVADSVPPKELKSVLYLSGGENSPWFYLGVLYAVEEYHIPVDSVVGTSWGAWVGFMWSRGMRLDDMQRLFLEEDFEPYVGHDNIAAKTELNPFEWPVSMEGIPSLRYRFALRQDSSGFPRRISKPLVLDSAGIERALSRLRFQESLYRQSVKPKIPFAVLACDGTTSDAGDDVFKSLPLPGNAESGEVCPYLALPAEDSPDEFAIIAIADPIRAEMTGNPWQRALKKYVAEGLNNRPGLIVRAHSILDSLHKSYIQAGFSAMEKRMGSLPFGSMRKMDYDSTKVEVYPWFRYNPTFDSLSSEKHIAAKSYWDENDTGLVAPRRFAYALSQNPVYDSLSFDMQANGDLVVGAKSSPVFDVAAGGFGSNAFGPIAYAEMGVRFVDQMEFNLNLGGFWGISSYGLRPQFNIERLWNKNWSVTFAYEWQKVRPLKSFNNDIAPEDRIYSERRSDLSAKVTYALDEMQNISLGFMFGNREFEMDTLAYDEHFFNTYPVSPNLHYELLSGKRDKWFATDGYAVDADLGLQSIGFELGRADLIPIYLKGELDARYTVSPKEFVTFSFGVAGGFEVYHEDSNNYVAADNDYDSEDEENVRRSADSAHYKGSYVYPKDFDYAVLGNCYRLHPETSPWSTEWYNATLASHHYALARMSAALHYKGSGLWLFGAFVHDFENNPSVDLGVNKIVLEPTFRLTYRSINVLLGLSRIVDLETVRDLKEFSDYTFFIRIGNYDLF